MRIGVGGVVGLVLSTATCAPAAPPGSPVTSDPTSIAAVHARVCGNCHVPPEPGTRMRSHLESAFTRHARRVRLTPDQWIAMVDYLAQR
jgi:hypothetical protein